ncbi:MAG: lipocalin family protein [Chloroflexi bacterium]|nr:lipocalin family protein [Chloroflexota bacterium]
MMILFPAGCSSTQQGESLLGAWHLKYVYQDGNKMDSIPNSESTTLEFFPDGTVTVDLGEPSEPEMTRSNYTIVGDTLTFDGIVGVFLGTEYRIKIDGNTLLLINNVNTLEFTRLK